LPHIGNDVVDLISPANRQKSTDSRYLKKILTDTEIEQVLCSDDPDAALWSIWVCKEAAYKVLIKQTGDAVFVPRRWSVHFQNSSPAAIRHGRPAPDDAQINENTSEFTTGDVIIPGRQSIPVRLFSSFSYRHCLAADCLDALDQAIWRVVTLPEAQKGTENDPSAFARGCLARRLGTFLKEDSCQIEIRRQKKDGELQPPVVYLNDVKTDIDISLSHDGRFVAYAMIYDDLVKSSPQP